MSTITDTMNFKICLGSSSKAMADREKERWRWKCTKFEYISQEELSLGEKKKLKNSRHKL